MGRTNPETAAARGRPREFDADEALANALQVFWSKSYAGASLTELTEAMGITRPSLYAAFGNKDALFKRAFDLYATDRWAYVQSALEAPTARGVAKRLLEGTVENVTDECRGCLGVTALVNSSDADPHVQQDVQARIQVLSDMVVERFQRAIDDGEFETPATAQALAQYLIAILQGLSIQAGAGASRQQLQHVADTTLAMWPSR